MTTYFNDSNNADPLVIADRIATNLYTDGYYSRSAIFRLGGPNTTNTPYGTADTDFFYQVLKIENNQWTRVMAYDIRSQNVFTISKINNHWGGWQYIAFGDYSSGFVTLDSTYVNRGTIEWIKVGRVVTINITNLNLKSWSDGDRRIGSGFPPSQLQPTRFSIPPLNGNTPSQLFAINSDGTFDTNGGVSHVGDFYGSFTYIASSW